MKQAKILWIVGAVSAFLSVAAGAFGAHALRQSLPADRLSAFETAARYEMYHALALLAVACAASQWRAAATLRCAGWSFILGTVLFSGSLYALALTGARWLGALTPFGGMAFLAGWALLAWSIKVQPVPESERDPD